MKTIEERLRSVLAATDPSIAMSGPAHQVTGYLNDLWFYAGEAGPLVAKLRRVPEEDPEQLLAYRRSMALLRHEGFPTPDLLLLIDECSELDGRQLSILRRVRGVPGSDMIAGLAPSRRSMIFSDLGRVVGRLHTITLPAATVWRDDTGLAHPGWPDVLRSSLDESRRELSDLGGEHQRLITRVAHRVERQIDDLATGLPPRLVHRDLHLGNALIDPRTGSITALLDFEMVREWDAAYDFAKINSSIFAAFPDATAPFTRGYRELAEPDDHFADRVHLYEGLYGLLTAADHLGGNDAHRAWPDRLTGWLARSSGDRP